MLSTELLSPLVLELDMILGVGSLQVNKSKDLIGW